MPERSLTACSNLAPRRQIESLAAAASHQQAAARETEQRLTQRAKQAEAQLAGASEAQRAAMARAEAAEDAAAAARDAAHAAAAAVADVKARCEAEQARCGSGLRDAPWGLNVPSSSLGMQAGLMLTLWFDAVAG